MLLNNKPWGFSGLPLWILNLKHDSSNSVLGHVRIYQCTYICAYMYIYIYASIYIHTDVYMYFIYFLYTMGKILY